MALPPVGAATAGQVMLTAPGATLVALASLIDGASGSKSDQTVLPIDAGSEFPIAFCAVTEMRTPLSGPLPGVVMTQPLVIAHGVTENSLPSPRVALTWYPMIGELLKPPGAQAMVTDLSAKEVTVTPVTGSGTSWICRVTAPHT